MAQMYDDFAGWVDVDPNSDIYKQYQARQAQTQNQPGLMTPTIPTINPAQQQAGLITQPRTPPVPAPNTTLQGSEGAQYGLGMAYQAIQGNQASPYPSYVPSQANAPSYGDFTAYQPNEPMAQIKTPNYQLSATAPTGDWNSVSAPNLQGMLSAPQWQNVNFNSQQVTNPYAAYGGNPDIQAALINQQYQKLGVAPTYQTAGTDAQVSPFDFQNYGVATPSYQGLMGGDYAALQKALTTPGEMAATQAYNSGMNNLINTMGGRGLYGSSIMQNQATEGLDKVYQDALSVNAANAVAQRYGMQQRDLANASAQQMAGWQSGMNQSLAGNQANLNYAGLTTGVNQQNIANALAQSQNKNAFGLDIYGQQMAENQAVNQQGYNVALANQADIQQRNQLGQRTWEQRLAEGQAGQQMGLQAQLANQANQQELNELYNSVYGQQMGENQAANQQAMQVAGLNQADIQQRNQLGQQAWQQRLAESQTGQQMGLQAQLANQANQQNLNQLNATQNLARNAQGANIYGQQLGYQQNQQGLMTDIYGKQLANQQAKNAFNQNIYGLDIGREQNANNFNAQMAQLGMTQNQNIYNSGLADAVRQQSYGTDVLNYNNQRNEALRQWQNQQNLEQFQYQLASQAYARQQQEQAVNQALALAGQGAPLAAAQQNYQLAQQQMNAGLMGGLTNTAGTIAGMYAMNQMGLLGNGG